MSPTPPQLNTWNIFFISLVLFTTFLFFIPRAFIPADLGNTILTVIAFLFGIIAGFYIIVTTTDYNSVKNILASETDKGRVHPSETEYRVGTYMNFPESTERKVETWRS